jgi:hypothetical protein
MDIDDAVRRAAPGCYIRICGQAFSGDELKIQVDGELTCTQLIAIAKLLVEYRDRQPDGLYRASLPITLDSV